MWYDGNFEPFIDLFDRELTKITIFKEQECNYVRRYKELIKHSLQSPNS